MRCAASPSHSTGTLFSVSPERRGRGGGREEDFSARSRYRRVLATWDAIARRFSGAGFLGVCMCVRVCVLRLRARVLTCSNKTRVSASMDRLARSIDRALAGRSIQTTAVPVAGALRSPSSISSVFPSSSSSCRRDCSSFPSSSSTFSAVVARACFTSFFLSRVRETVETLFISTGSARARAHGSRAPQSVTSAASVRPLRSSRRGLSKRR